jgi:hypothetical protein
MDLAHFRFTVIFALLGINLASAQLPVARLLTVSPAGGQIGTTFEVSVSGADLDELAELRFSDTNISAKPKLSPDSGLSEPNKFIVTITSNALPGFAEVRAIGRFGISNPRAFASGQLPEAGEKAGIQTPATAMDVTINSTINAQADANAVDHFRFAAKKGQRILIECRAKAIVSRMDPSMILYDSAGRELERARNEELIDFIAPDDGTNLLKVSDFLYRGGPEFFYRLTLHTGPRVDFVLPPSAVAGTTNKHMVYGRNLPGGAPAKGMALHGKPIEQLSIDIAAPVTAQLPTLAQPAALSVRGFYHRLNGGPVSEPFFIALADAPVVLEQDNNDRAESAQKAALPCEYVGQLFPAGDHDWITFDAKKGEVYWLEMFSHRLGVPADPFFLVQRVTKNDKGEISITDLQEAYDSDTSIGGQEFKTSSFDPAWRFEVKDDGAYRVQVRDLFNRTSSDPEHVYRLAIRKETPDFQLAALPQLPGTKKEREVTPWNAVLRRGETVPVRVLALRRNGFSGDISLTAEGCPSDISVTSTKIDSGKNSALLFFTAAPGASNWSGNVKIVGKAKQGETEIVREAVAGTTLWRVEDYNTEATEARLTPTVTLAVAPETAPLLITVAATNALEATVGTKLPIPLTVTRNGDFTEKFKLKVAGAAALDAVKEVEIDGKATNAAFEIDLAQTKLAAGPYTLYFQTQAKGKYSNNPDGAKQADAVAKEAETNATHVAAEAKKASESLAAAAKAAMEADAAAKSAAEKLSAAKSAAEANAADEKLATARTDAEKAATEAAAKTKAATEAKDSAEKASAELAARAKSSEARKTALAARAKELADRAKPKELTISVYSRPFEIKVNPAPATASK